MKEFIFVININYGLIYIQATNFGHVYRADDGKDVLEGRKARPSNEREVEDNSTEQCKAVLKAGDRGKRFRCH
jgi:hypothetical protein